MSSDQLTLVICVVYMGSGQNIVTSQDLGPQKVAKEGNSPYFRKIQVGDIVWPDGIYFSAQLLQIISYAIIRIPTKTSQ